MPTLWLFLVAECLGLNMSWEINRNPLVWRWLPVSFVTAGGFWYNQTLPSQYQGLEPLLKEDRQLMVKSRLVAVVIVAGLSGCSGGPSEVSDSSATTSIENFLTEEQIAEGVSAQADAMRDGVSIDEYESALARVQDCAASGGMGVEIYGLDPVNQNELLYVFALNGVEIDLADVINRDCVIAHIYDVGEAYKRENEGLMDTELMSFVQACADGASIPLSGDELSAHDLVQSAGREHIAELETCVLDGVDELFPEIPGVEFRW
jgi:hypothetical protein